MCPPQWWRHHSLCCTVCPQLSGTVLRGSRSTQVWTRPSLARPAQLVSAAAQHVHRVGDGCAGVVCPPGVGRWLYPFQSMCPPRTWSSCPLLWAMIVLMKKKGINDKLLRCSASPPQGGGWLCGGRRAHHVMGGGRTPSRWTGVVCPRKWTLQNEEKKTGMAADEAGRR